MVGLQEKAARREPLAVLSVNMGDDIPKANLTLEEGRDVSDTVR